MLVDQSQDWVRALRETCESETLKKLDGMDVDGAYQENALAPVTRPLSANTRNPALTASRARPNVQLGLNADAHAEVDINRRDRQHQRASDVGLVKLVAEVIGRDLVLEHRLVPSARCQVFPLARRVLSAHLIAVDAAHLGALLIALRWHLNERGMDVVKRDFGQVGITGRFGLLLLGRCSLTAERRSGMAGRAVDSRVGVGREVQVGMLGLVGGSNGRSRSCSSSGGGTGSSSIFVGIGSRHWGQRSDMSGVLWSVLGIVGGNGLWLLRLLLRLLLLRSRRGRGRKNGSSLGCGRGGLEGDVGMCLEVRPAGQ